MIRFLVRSIGLWSLAGGFAAAVIDGMKSIAASRPVTTPLLDTWSDLAPASLAASGAWVDSHVGAEVWAVVSRSVLVLPTWALLGGLGVLLIALGHRRETPEASEA